MAGKIMTAQQRIIDLLKADAFFTDPQGEKKSVAVISKRVGDIEAAIDEKLAEIGIGLIVIMRNAKRADEGRGPLSLDVQYALSAVENVIANDTGKTAEDIVEKAAAILDDQPNGVPPAGVYTEPDRFVVDRNAIGPVPQRNPAINMQALLVNTSITLTS